jgi:hypothetical protein
MQETRHEVTATTGRTSARARRTMCRPTKPWAPATATIIRSLAGSENGDDGIPLEFSCGHESGGDDVTDFFSRKTVTDAMYFKSDAASHAAATLPSRRYDRTGGRLQIFRSFAQ